MAIRNSKNLRAKRIARTRANQVCLFFLTMYVLSAISLMIPIRPTHSDMENRDLKTFPKMTAKALVSGSLFDDINGWFSDTFPMRDGWMKMSTTIQSTYGFTHTDVHGNVEEGDVIPEGPMTELTDTVTTTTLEQQTEPTKPPVPAETIGALLVVGDTAYEYYNFKQDEANVYIKAINRAAEQLKGVATVYDVIIPTSMEIAADESVRAGINTSDQKKAIDYMYGSMSPNVKKVDAYGVLKKAQAANEYIYFRTDHHWTAMGAYRTYEEYCRMRNVTPTSLAVFEKQVYDGYLGSFYRDTNTAAMQGNPDYVEAFVPPSTNDMHMLMKDGTELDYAIITDVTDWSELYKYNTFIGGDNPISTIENPNKADGSAVLLVKESFGNAFAPFLVEDYQTVHILDYRYFSQFDSRSLAQYVKDNGIEDVVFMNNISATRTASLVNAMDSLIR